MEPEKVIVKDPSANEEKTLFEKAKKMGLIDPKEGKTLKKKYKEFVVYLHSVVNATEDNLIGEAAFFTKDKKMLKDSKKLTKKFGMAIFAYEEENISEEEHAKLTNYIG
jgi:hypothetical protein